MKSCKGKPLDSGYAEFSTARIVRHNLRQSDCSTSDVLLLDAYLRTGRVEALSFTGQYKDGSREVSFMLRPIMSSTGVESIN